MKKILLPIAVIFFNTITYGQVGINTADPKATLDIVAKNSNGTSSLVDGLLIPRVDRQRAVNMASVQPSTLIYVNNIATGTATGQGSNIDSTGFYYFDGATSKWSKLTAGIGTGDPTPDAFVDDAANIMVKLGATSTGSGRVAGSEFVIKDAGNVGIGTSTPGQKLDVKGNGKFEANAAQIEVISTGVNAANINLVRNNGNTNMAVGQLLGFFNFGGYSGSANQVMSAITADKRNAPNNLGSGLNFYTNGVADGSKMSLDEFGNLGIGTSAPTQKLDVRGNGKFESNDSQLEVISTSTNPANINLVRNNGNTNMAVGQLLGFFNFGGYAGSANQVMSAITADKRNAPNNLGSGLNFYTNGVADGPKMSLDEFGNLGIGTSAPTQKLDVNGNVRLRNVPNAASVDNTDRIMVLQSDGTGKKVPLASLQPADTYTPRGIFVSAPSGPVTWALNQSYSSTVIVNDIDINYSMTVYVPANTSSLVIFNYSVPTGLTDSTGDLLRASTSGIIYQGIRFVRNGIEAPAGSRKFIQKGVSTVSGVYTETYNNTTSSQVAITFRLDGYLEIGDGTNFPSGAFARFNMVRSSGANYNWGKGTLTLQQFDKSL